MCEHCKWKKKKKCIENYNYSTGDKDEGWILLLGKNWPTECLESTIMSTIDNRNVKVTASSSNVGEMT